MDTYTEAGKTILRCPTGCGFDELELGKEDQSFMAMLGAPHQFVRCGKCGFNGDPKLAALSVSRDGAIEKWNAAVSAALSKAEGREVEG